MWDHYFIEQSQVHCARIERRLLRISPCQILYRKITFFKTAQNFHIAKNHDFPAPPAKRSLSGYFYPSSSSFESLRRKEYALAVLLGVGVDKHHAKLISSVNVTTKLICVDEK